MLFHLQRWILKLNSTEVNGKWNTTISLIRYYKGSPIQIGQMEGAWNWIWLPKKAVGTASMHYWRPIFEAKLIDFQQFCFRFTLIFIQSVPWMKHRRNLQNVLTLCDFFSIFGENLWRWRFDLGKALIHYSLWTELQILIRIHIRHSPILPQHPDFHFLTRVISADINIVHC